MDFADDKAALEAEDRLVEGFDGGEQWEDPDFVPGGLALYHDPSSPPCGQAPADLVEWNRLNLGEVAGCVHAHTFVGEPGSNKISRGALRDGWAVSAMAVLSPAMLRAIFVSDRHGEEHGVYTLRLWKGGRPRYVRVDDRIPCDQTSRPLYAASAERNETWPMLLEKAYAKLHGCYQALAHGNIGYALQDMTGGAAITRSLPIATGGGGGGALSSAAPADALEPGAVVPLLTQALGEGGSVVCAVAEHPAAGTGLTTGLAYVVERVEKVEAEETPDAAALSTHLLRLRSPWAYKGCAWRGAWCAAHPCWDEYPAVRAQLLPGELDEEEGRLWIELRDFVRQFARVVVCIDGQRAPWDRQRLQGRWVPGSKSSGAVGAPCCGPGQLQEFRANPQFSVSLSSSARLCVVLEQRDVRWQGYEGAVGDAGGDGGSGGAGGPEATGPEAAGVASIGFVVMQVAGENRRAHSFHPSRMVGASLAFSSARGVTHMLEDTLEPGRYAIVPCTYAAAAPSDAPRSFTLQLFSSRKLKVDPDTVGGAFPDAQLAEEEPEEDEALESEDEDGLFVEERARADPEDEGCEVALLSRNVGELASLVSQLGADMEKLKGRVAAME
eukprot:g7316.t1